MDVITQLEAILPSVADLAEGVRPTQFDDPTPCENFRVRDLFDHMIVGASQFAPQLRGEEPGPPPELTDADRPGAIKEKLDEILASLRAPGAMERSVQLPFGEIPGAVLARFLTVDGMVHSWDLAQATGQTYEPPEDLARQVLATARELIAPEMRDGDTFADQVPVPDDAPAITQLVAFTGRKVS